ncbi:MULTISPECIES: TetR/AcrR family transcriptional regulator [unclassified Streptomyces]|uniref:TetR/AcrR family transcriptional regulator n=1 Tax=unclassified Streptomyces TaxID=2593676 RepID=UPI0003760EB5|nr:MULTISPECIES: TetR/AcrR family transcriptional regulator [unclassified Streptomyces]MYT28796.1 TetR family transcriptional regulator [Streptomyces sp. SID8354]
MSKSTRDSETTAADAPPAGSTQERLVTSTQELLWERGYVGTSPKAILERAGVGQGSMYHHFAGKSALALAAIRRTADGMRASADEILSAPGTAYDRVAAYLLRERQVLRGCPIGRMTQDRDVVQDPELRAPLDEMFGWLRQRIAEVLTEGQRRGELAAALDPSATAASVAAVVQGGYVLARAAEDPAPFDAAVQGLLALLAAQSTTAPAPAPARGNGPAAP